MQIATIAILWKCTFFFFFFTKYVAKFSTSCCPAGHPFIRPHILHKMSTTFLSDFIEHTRYAVYKSAYIHCVFCLQLCQWFMWKEWENYHGQDVWNWVGVWCIVCLGLAVMRFRQYQLWVADIPFIMNRVPEVTSFPEMNTILDILNN